MTSRAAPQERRVAKVEDAVTQGETFPEGKTDMTKITNDISSYFCDVVEGQQGCCPNGETCTTGGGGNDECANTDYVLCPGEDFCCRMCSGSHVPLVPSAHNGGFFF